MCIFSCVVFAFVFLNDDSVIFLVIVAIVFFLYSYSHIGVIVYFMDASVVSCNSPHQFFRTELCFVDMGT